MGRVMTGLRRNRRKVEIARFERADATMTKAGMNASGVCAIGGGETMAQADSIALPALLHRNDVA